MTVVDKNICHMMVLGKQSRVTLVIAEVGMFQSASDEQCAFFI